MPRIRKIIECNPQSPEPSLVSKYINPFQSLHALEVWQSWGDITARTTGLYEDVVVPLIKTLDIIHFGLRELYLEEFINRTEINVPIVSNPTWHNYRVDIRQNIPDGYFRTGSNFN